MIPCPYCERGFEKRAGLMRHVTASHHSEGVVPTNPGGAIEPVVPVAPETWAESLTEDQLAPGQEPYVDPAVEKVMGMWTDAMPAEAVHLVGVELANGTFIDDVWHERSAAAVADTVRAPTSEQYTRIRALRRQGHQEAEAWMTVVGYPPPPRETPTEDSRPLRLQQVAFRVREGNTDHIDATWLLRLAEIGRETVDLLDAHIRGVDVRSELLDVVDRWNETIA